MNRQKALEWLVENVTKWPTDIDFSATSDEWDFWELFDGDIVFSQYHGWLEYPDESGSNAEIITQSDWLSATDNMKEKCDE